MGADRTGGAFCTGSDAISGGGVRLERNGNGLGLRKGRTAKRFCSSEMDSESSDADERLKETGLKAGPGGESAFPTQAQVTAWAREASKQARARVVFFP
jgi:hypothetical protein